MRHWGGIQSSVVLLTTRPRGSRAQRIACTWSRAPELSQPGTQPSSDLPAAGTVTIPGYAGFSIICHQKLPEWFSHWKRIPGPSHNESHSKHKKCYCSWVNKMSLVYQHGLWGNTRTRCLLEMVHCDPQIPGKRLTREWRNVLGLSQTEPSRPGIRGERAIVQLSPESRALLWVCKNYSWSPLFYLKPYVFLFTFRLVFLFWLNLLILFSVTLNNSTVPERESLLSHPNIQGKWKRRVKKLA